MWIRKSYVFNCNLKKKLRAFNLGKCWDAICNMAFQKIKMQICIAKKLLVVWSWTWYAENIYLLKKYHRFLCREIKRCACNTSPYSKKCFESIPYFFEFVIIKFCWTIPILSLISNVFKTLQKALFIHGKTETLM